MVPGVCICSVCDAGMGFVTGMYMYGLTPVWQKVHIHELFTVCAACAAIVYLYYSHMCVNVSQCGWINRLLYATTESKFTRTMALLIFEDRMR